MNTTEELRHMHARVIGDTIRRTIRPDIPYSKTTLENNDTAIRVVDEDWELNIWIRLYHIKDFVVEFSTVELPKEFRRKGIFTKVFNAIKEEELVKEIRVTSVVTDEMKNWCIKNGFKSTDEINYVYRIEH